MIQVSTKAFRASMSSYLDKAYDGEQLVISRKNQRFVVTPVDEDDFVLTPEVMARIEQARKEIAAGEYTSVRTREELEKMFEMI